MLKLTVHHVLLQAIFWNTVAQHSTSLGLHLEDLARMPAQG